MTIRTVYHASDGTQHDSRASAQRYERACEFVLWLVGRGDLTPNTDKQVLAKDLSERWYLHDRQAPRRTRGAPKFTGRNCLQCGGRTEEIAGCEVCAVCNTELATALRAKETERAPTG